MRALVTGGLGFIGSHVTQALLDRGFDVVVVDDLSTGNRGNERPGAVNRIEKVSEIPVSTLESFDFVFHLAALPRIIPSFTEVMEHEEANVIETLVLLQRLAKSKRIRKVVFSSSSGVYGNPQVVPTTEDCPVAPLSPYALQKYTSEQYSLLLGAHWGLPVIALRYFNPYGPRSFNPNNPHNAYSSVIGIFHHQKKSGQTLSITGDGSQRRDFIHVRDVSEANVLSALSDASTGVYNIGSGTTASVLEVAQLFDHPYDFLPARIGEARITHADISRVTSELGWRPTISLKQGIDMLCDE